MLSAAQSICTSKNDGIEGGGWVKAQAAVHTVAVTLASTGWAFLSLLAQTGIETAPLPW